MVYGFAVYGVGFDGLGVVYGSLDLVLDFVGWFRV